MVEFGSVSLTGRNRNLSVLIHINNFLSSCLSPEDVLQAAASKVMEHFGFMSARMYLMDESRGILKLMASRGLDTTGLEEIRISEGFTGKAARTRSFIAQRVSDLEDRERAALLRAKGLRFVVCVPLIHMDRVLGVMNLGADRSLQLSEARIDLLVAVGNAVAVAVSHSRLCEELARNVEALGEKNETIEFFTYTASHDIKSPLVGIYGLAKLLARQYGNVLDERGKSYCDQILKAAEQVVALVDGINTYVKSKEALPLLEVVRIQEVIESIRDEFAEALSRRRIRWKQPETLPAIVADKMGMQRIFRNLVENALKYGGEALSEIAIGHGEDSALHSFSVSDDGVGIQTEGQEKLFKPFYRHKTSEGTEGTGLGLSIVKEIAERHGGKAWLDPAAPRGATFCFSVSKALKPQETSGLGQQNVKEPKPH